MKTFNMTLLIYALIFSGILINLSSCQKQQETQTTQTIVDNETLQLTNHILDFKERMELFRDTPGIKSEIKYPAPDATTELENLINFNFVNGAILVNKQEIVYSETSMPLDVLSEIGESKLSEFYYNQVINLIQAQMLALNYTNMKLLYVDLEHKGTDSEGNAIIGISSVIGNEGSLQIVITETGWKFGFARGDCDGNYINGLDAAQLLEYELNKTNNDLPPSGYVWRWKDIVTVGPLHAQTGNTEWVNPDDDVIEDNYQDYLIYYANSEFNTPQVLTVEDECISSDSEIGWNLEMQFYEISYSLIGENKMAENNGNQWRITIEPFDGPDPNNNLNSIYSHFIHITSSYKYPSPISETNVQDILSYN